jgi:DNA-directed RNA polymerase subunit D
MKLAKVKGKGNLLELEIKDSNDWYVNTLRRLMTNEVPVMAIEVVAITKNKKHDSILYDEVLSHRLGLIPLTTDLSSYVLPTQEEMDTQEYLAQSSCKFTLEVKGPGIVYAKDLKSKDPKIKPVFPDMPIAKLLDNQEIILEATAVMGVGRVHAKWSSGHMFYRKIPAITIKNPSNIACAQVCPTGTLVEKNGKTVLTDERTCILCMACVDVDGGKSVEVVPANDFLFKIESWGQLEPGEIIQKSLDVYNQQLKEFEALLKQQE